MGKDTQVRPISSILFATFSPWKNNVRAATNGMIDPFYYYFKPRVKRLAILDQPYPGSDKYFPTIEMYEKNELKRMIKTSRLIFPLLPFLFLENKPGTRISFKIRDFLSVIEAGFISEKHDLFIGLESINALAGILLRKLGRVKYVAYYVSDYSPNRYPSKLLNKVYLWLDKVCAENADFIWDVSPAMHPARLTAGVDKNKAAPVIDIPNAMFKEQLIQLPVKEREKNTVVFVGTLGLENGPDLAVEAFAIVLKKIKNAHLHIIGGGGQGFEGEYLRNIIEKHKITKHVTFHGFISDVKKISSIIKHFQIAVAPYKMIPGSIRLYGDATKIRQYVAAGLPVITTPVPPLGKVVAKHGGAIIVEDKKEAIADAIIELLQNETKRIKITENAIAYAKSNTWENTYGTAIKKMGFRLET